MIKKIVSGVAFLLLIVGIVLFAAGAFRGDRIEPGKAPPPLGHEPPARTATAERAEVDVYEDAVGTVTSRTEVEVSAQVTARVKEVTADAGSRVTAKTPLILLDDRELVARHLQAREGLDQAKAARARTQHAQKRAKAALVQAEKTHGRMKSLLETTAVSEEAADQAETAYLQAQAGVAEAEAAEAVAEARIQQVEEQVKEAKVAVEHATILVPITGAVSMKAVEVGDLAWPGKTLMEILDPSSLRLEAQVREGLIAHVSMLDELYVDIPATGERVLGTVAELCPTADPLSRTFKVRVDIEPGPAAKPGMFGRLRVPLGKREVVRVPAAAVGRTGQLEAVLVKTGERWDWRMVTTGVALPDEHVEVLSGLAGGETIGLPEAD